MDLERAVDNIAFCTEIPRNPYPAVAVSSAGWLNQTNKLLPELLCASELIVPKNEELARACSGFVQWGIQESDSKARLRQYAANLGKPLAFIEDGFIRSLDIGLSQEPGRSIILDDLGFYYDASRPTRLETILNSASSIGILNRFRARRAMALIRKHRISKYNNAPDILPTSLPSSRDRRRVLVLDQRAGDASIKGALGSELSFKRMLDEAFNQTEAQIVVKIHPDALTPGKFSAISSALADYYDNPRLIIVSEGVNPYVLFEAVDEVFVVSSGMGFEALLAGKAVTCFGVPYYAGWGLTRDMVDVPRRTVRRSLEEIFYVAWIQLSRYADPKTRRLVSIEATIRTLAEERKSKGLTLG